MLIYELSYIAFAILLAWYNAYLIKKGKKIRHALQGGIHLAVGLVCWHSYWWGGVWIILCNTNVVFSVSLNLFRKLPINYISTSTGSIIDKMEQKLFGNDFYTPKIAYLCCSLILNMVYYVFFIK